MTTKRTSQNIFEISLVSFIIIAVLILAISITIKEISARNRLNESEHQEHLESSIQNTSF